MIINWELHPVNRDCRLATCETCGDYVGAVKVLDSGYWTVVAECDRLLRTMAESFADARDSLI